MITLRKKNVHPHRAKVLVFLTFIIIISALLGQGLPEVNCQSKMKDNDPAHESGVTIVQDKLLTPEQTLKRRNISDLRLSPDESKIAMVVSEPVKGTSSRRNIWIYNIIRKEIIHFTTSEKSDSRPRWSPDGKTLAFLSSRGEKTQICFIPVDGGEAQTFTESKTGIGSFEWSPDGKQIAFLSMTPKSEEEEKREKDKDDERVVDKDDRHPQLRIIDIETKKIRQITEEKWRISSAAWTPDGKYLIISATNHPQPELLTNRIYSVRASDGKMTEIGGHHGPFGNLKVSPDGTTLAFAGSRTDGPTSFDLFLLPIKGGQSENITRASIDRSIGSYQWRKDSSLLVLCPEGFSRTFYSLTPEGTAKKLASFPVQPRSFTAGKELLAFTGATTIQAPELWISTKIGDAEKVTDFNKEWDTIDLIQPEIIQYPSFDGKLIEAGLLKPAGSREGTKVPLIVLVHGGPTGGWSDRFHSWGQLLAARGFAVLSPNIRGSTGYGHEFMIMNRKDWGGGDFKDVMAGVDFMIEKGVADPERLGIGGWSYGGYMAAWAVTQTNRFKASVSGAPMTDLALEYGAESNSINAYDTWFLGTPYENLDLFIERSPMTHVKNVKTPTLILCGENDVTDPIAQCFQFHRGLKRYGVETDFVVYPREGHGIREEKHQIDMLNRMLQWFEKYVK